MPLPSPTFNPSAGPAFQGRRTFPFTHGYPLSLSTLGQAPPNPAAHPQQPGNTQATTQGIMQTAQKFAMAPMSGLPQPTPGLTANAPPPPLAGAMAQPQQAGMAPGQPAAPQQPPMAQPGQPAQPQGAMPQPPVPPMASPPPQTLPANPRPFPAGMPPTPGQQQQVSMGQGLLDQGMMATNMPGQEDLTDDLMGAGAKTAGDPTALHRGWQWRALNAEEDQNTQNWMPRLFTSKDTPVAETLASPAKQGLLQALIGAGVGGAAGGFGAQHYGLDPVQGAGVGAGLGGVLGGLHGYGSRRRKNDSIVDSMRFLPPGATLGEVGELNKSRQAKQAMDDCWANGCGPDGNGGCRCEGRCRKCSPLAKSAFTTPMLAGATVPPAGGEARPVHPEQKPRTSPQLMTDLKQKALATAAKVAALSATGESGLAFNYKADHHAKGQDAWASLDGYFKGGSKLTSSPSPYSGRHRGEEKSAGGWGTALGEAWQGAKGFLPKMLSKAEPYIPGAVKQVAPHVPGMALGAMGGYHTGEEMTGSPYGGAAGAVLGAATMNPAMSRGIIRHGGPVGSPLVRGFGGAWRGEMLGQAADLGAGAIGLDGTNFEGIGRNIGGLGGLARGIGAAGRRMGAAPGYRGTADGGASLHPAPPSNAWVGGSRPAWAVAAGQAGQGIMQSQGLGTRAAGNWGRTGNALGGLTPSTAAGRFGLLGGLGAGAAMGGRSMLDAVGRRAGVNAAGGAMDTFMQNEDGLRNYANQRFVQPLVGAAARGVGDYAHQAISGIGQNLTGHADQLLRHVGLDPETMTEGQKLMLLGGTGAAGVGLATGHPGMAGLAGLAAGYGGMHGLPGMGGQYAPPNTPVARDEYQNELARTNQGQPR